MHGVNNCVCMDLLVAVEFFYPYSEKYLLCKILPRSCCVSLAFCKVFKILMGRCIIKGA